MVAGRAGRGLLAGGFGDAGCPSGGSRAVGRDRWMAARGQVMFASIPSAL